MQAVAGREFVGLRPSARAIVPIDVGRARIVTGRRRSIVLPGSDDGCVAAYPDGIPKVVILSGVIRGQLLELFERE
jgi:hypothetical protein